MGAEDGTRTRDPRITNALLYQLSHYRIATFYHCKINEFL